MDTDARAKSKHGKHLQESQLVIWEFTNDTNARDACSVTWTKLGFLHLQIGAARFFRATRRVHLIRITA